MLLPQMLRRTLARVVRKGYRLLTLPKRLSDARYLRQLRSRLGEESPRPASFDEAPPRRQSAPGSQLAPQAEKNYEDVIEHVYRGVLRSGGTAIDIGANIGRHTLGLADCIFPDGCVIAFEPLPGCRAKLERLFQEKESHQRLRKRIVLSPLALAAAPTSAEFVHAVDVPGWSGLKERTYDGPTRLEKIQVTVETLDRVLVDLKRCDFIKIDAEGGEYDALRGGEQLLRRCRPIVAFEFGAASCTAYGIQTTDLAGFWEKLGYRVVDINGKLLTAVEFARSAVDQKVWDYFAVPSERTDLITLVQQRCRD